MNVFVVLDGIVRASSVMTGWGFAVVSVEPVLTCVVKCERCTRPCVVSMTTLLYLIKYYTVVPHKVQPYDWLC